MDKRLGFHYFQDANHYQMKDLSLWLPELTALNASWVVLKSLATQAIPEDFIVNLSRAGIEPIIDFDLQINGQVRSVDLQLLLNTYAKWGAKYVLFFRSPNMRSSWSDGTWSQGDLVERFLDRYLPFVRMAERSGLTPIFPALEPGGDYWDLSFLKRFLQLLQHRKSAGFASNLHLAVSAQTFSKPLSWGAGGSERWKTPLPYSKCEIGEEDHIGFNTWEWYQEMVRSTLHITPKLFLLWFGSSKYRENALDPSISFDQLVPIINGSQNQSSPAIRLPENVKACICWMLASNDTEGLGKTAWFDENGNPKAPTTAEYKNRVEENRKHKSEYAIADQVANWMYPIDHYLLLPSYEWGVPENTFDRVRPIIRDSKPTIGFSIFEAVNARKVTIWNENSAFSQQDIDMLREAGCVIDEQVVKSISLDTY